MITILVIRFIAFRKGHERNRSLAGCSLSSLQPLIDTDSLSDCLIYFRTRVLYHMS